MSRKTAILAQIILLMPLVACQQRVATSSARPFRELYDIEGDGLRVTAVVAPMGLLRAEAERFGREFIEKSLKDGLRYSELLMVEEASVVAGPVFRLERDGSFQVVLNQLFTEGRSDLSTRPTARALQLGPAALLTYRDAGAPEKGRGLVHEVVLRGGYDPTQIKLASGNAVRLLQLTRKPGSKPGNLWLAAFFRSETEPSCAICEGAGARLYTHLQPQQLEVEIRQDAWFSNMSFPLFFPFASDEGFGVYVTLTGKVVPPSVEKYYMGSHTTCRFTAGVLSQCDTYGLREHLH